MSVLRLQNGSDIRGLSVSDEYEKITLGENEAEQIGSAFASWLISKRSQGQKPLKIAIGNDPRISSEWLKESLCKGINITGADSVDTGLSSTPSMFMATLTADIDASVMITASHLPFDRNGFKFFTPEGGLNSNDIGEILKTAEKMQFYLSDVPGKKEIRDLNQNYYNYLISSIRQRTGREKPLQDFKILVDAGNGSGGFFVRNILNELGADTSGSLFLDPDGMFPNHVPNPEDPEAITPLCRRVVEKNANLGIIFDTDVDRAAIVDPDGNPVARNELIALISTIILEEYPNSWIVTDSITSNGLTTFIEENLGGHHHRFKRGYRNVIDEAVSLNRSGKECHLAIETSGHAAIKENHFLDDGAYLIIRILSKVSELGPKRDISELIKDLKRPFESKEFRIIIECNDFIDYGNRVINSLEQFAAKIDGWSITPANYEGIRISCDKGSGDGWFLLRMSLHDPVLALNIESDIAGGIEYIVLNLTKFFEQYPELNYSKLSEYFSR